MNAPSRQRGTALIHLLMLTGGFVVGLLSMSLNKASSTDSRENRENSREFEEELAQLRSELLVAKAKPAEIIRIPSASRPLKSPISPADHIRALKTVPVDAEGWLLQRVVTHLQLLKDHGPKAVPSIQAYLLSGKNRYYIRRTPLSLEEPSIISASMRPLPKPSFVAPISLRVSLIEVLRQINTPAATAVLAQTLKTNRDGYEIALIAGLLERMAPGRYRTAVLQTCHDALSGDDLPKDVDYLFGLISRLDDPKAADLAKQHLLQPDGRLNQWAVRTLLESAKSTGISATPDFVRVHGQLQANSLGRKAMAGVILPHVGVDATADAFFERALATAERNASSSSPPSKNQLTLGRIGHYLLRSPIRGKSTSQLPVQVLQNRLRLLEQTLGRRMDNPKYRNSYNLIHRALTRWITEAKSESSKP